MNASLHNVFMVSFCHIPFPWFTSLHFYFCKMYPSCYHQMTILGKYIFRHKVSINNVSTLLFYFFKNLSQPCHQFGMWIVHLHIVTPTFFLFACIASSSVQHSLRCLGGNDKKDIACSHNSKYLKLHVCTSLGVGTLYWRCLIKTSLIFV